MVVLLSVRVFLQIDDAFSQVLDPGGGRLLHVSGVPAVSADAYQQPVRMVDSARTKSFRLQPLMPEAGPEGVLAVKVVYPADRVVDHELHEHEGQEWLYVLEGRLRLTLGVERTVLEPGDAAFFDARLPHDFDVLSAEDAEVLMVSCVPCTHRQVSPGGLHPFVEGHRGFGKAGHPQGGEGR